MLMNSTRLIRHWFVLLLELTLSDVVSRLGHAISLDVYDGRSWIVADSRALEINQQLKIRCSVHSTTSLSNDLLVLIWKDHSAAHPLTLRKTTEHTLYWETSHAQLNDSGIYECIYGSFAEVLTVYMYTFEHLHNVDIPTRVLLDRVGNTQFLRRDFDYGQSANPTRGWLSCGCMFASAHLLDVITVRWMGGMLDLLTNKTDLNALYSKATIRNASQKMITTRLRLNVPVLNRQAYGEYRCVFNFHNSESVIGQVYLRVPPILRLVYDPPPLPPFYIGRHTTCHSSLCNTSTNGTHSNSSDTKNWITACKLIVAYPDPYPSDFFWNWTHPEWANYAVKRVQLVGKTTYLSELEGFTVGRTLESPVPWQVLERRRRSADSADVFAGMNVRPPGPVIFWCWAKNELGETTVWWPGPIDDGKSTFWASVWWPVLGIAAELMSFAVVFGIFRYCSRKHQLRAYRSSSHNDGTSFGMSRLTDSRSPLDEASGTKRRHPVFDAHAVHYVRLPRQDSFPSLHLDGENRNLHTENTYTITGYSNPVGVTEEVETPLAVKNLPQKFRNEREPDEYFWDVDSEPKSSVFGR